MNQQNRNLELKLAILSKLFALSVFGILSISTASVSLYQSWANDRPIDGTLILGIMGFWAKMPEFGGRKEENNNSSENLEVTNIDSQTNIVGLTSRFPRADFEDERDS